MKEIIEEAKKLISLKTVKTEEKWRSSKRDILKEEERLLYNMKRRRDVKMKAERRFRKKKTSGGWTQVKIAIGVKRESEDCDCCQHKNNQFNPKSEKKRNNTTFHIMAYYYEPKISLTHYVNMDMHSKMMSLGSLDRCRHLVADIQTVGKVLNIGVD